MFSCFYLRTFRDASPDFLGGVVILGVDSLRKKRSNLYFFTSNMKSALGSQRNHLLVKRYWNFSLLGFVEFEFR